MKLKFKILTITALTLLVTSIPIFAKTNTTHIVQKGDTLWKISKKYEVGISEIINSNPQFKNPNLIYPNDTVYIPEADPQVKSIETEVLALVNAERKKYGLSALEMDWQVSRVATYKSEDMANKNYFSHTSPTYGSPFDMLKKFNISYSYAGENIAKGQTSPASVMNAWMNSEGHRANILNPNFTHLGVGYVDNGTTYWTQMFIAK